MKVEELAENYIALIEVQGLLNIIVTETGNGLQTAMEEVNLQTTTVGNTQINIQTRSSISYETDIMQKIKELEEQIQTIKKGAKPIKKEGKPFLKLYEKKVDVTTITKKDYLKSVQKEDDTEQLKIPNILTSS